jgi:hypothetical protein
MTPSRESIGPMAASGLWRAERISGILRFHPGYLWKFTIGRKDDISFFTCHTESANSRDFRSFDAGAAAGFA